MIKNLTAKHDGIGKGKWEEGGGVEVHAQVSVTMM